MNMSDAQKMIENAYENRASITAKNVVPSLRKTIDEIIEQLDRGERRVAEKINGHWVTHEWLKKTILLFFCIHENQMIKGLETAYYDKIPLKFSDYESDRFSRERLRVVPQATVRKGAFIAKNTVLMPSYVNVGAFVDEGTMIDTWATVGSCAQIGKNVHLSGGVGIGGVLEPLQTNPTIIEDNCFIGARSEIVEGVLVEEGAVISMGVFISQSTRIYDRETQTMHYGRVPAGAVVVPGSLPAKDGSHSLYAAIIVKKVDAKTKEKISMNQLLRYDECLQKESF